MKTASRLLCVLLALCLSVSVSCATTRADFTRADFSEPGATQERPVVVPVTRLGEDQFQLDFAPLPPDPFYEVVREDEARAALADLLECLSEAPPFEIVPALTTTGGTATPWEQRLRTEFFARYGPPRLPIPGSIQRSPLFMALQLSPRYMGSGFRDAARELFRSPIFLASVALSIVVYFSAWLMPEPLFSKAFAATLTARLALVVGLLELRNVAMACLQLYREAQAARSMAEIEAVAERFGRALGGTALRVLVMVASYGLAKALPNVPPGGLGPLLSSPRYALPGGLTFQAASSAHVVADGTLVIAGAAMGTAGTALGEACSDGSEKKEGAQWHHLATDKNETSSAQGGPWTPLFKRLFDRAGMSLDDRANLVYLQGHQGPHSEEYHREVYRQLLRAIGRCKSLSECRSRLVTTLQEIARDVCTPGSQLHRLVTNTQE